MGHLDAIHWEVGLMALMKRDHVVLFMCKNGIFLFNMCERDFFLLLKSVGFFKMGILDDMISHSILHNPRIS